MGIELGFLFVLKISSLQLLVDHWVLLGIGRLCIIFLGFDVFFVVFCVTLACMIGIAVCCCLSCIFSLLYAIIDQNIDALFSHSLVYLFDLLLKQDGASKEDIEQLSKFRFRKVANEKVAGDVQGGVMTECGTDSPIEHECCICLSCYDDGVELRQLPCAHHFHCFYINKWLFINTTYPLYKYNILKSSSQNQGEV
ncbi:hypothetical protein DVH24_041148 [Malus domestica]|uniref:RING-type E3 ubiquitin transferase n=1 Tax=Malus domestica TaxID=3750 RepID=A0A498IEJ2_MALDO|nr:hypothetical protein DVH24_041148 [Malus domestica]